MDCYKEDGVKVITFTCVGFGTLKIYGDKMVEHLLSLMTFDHDVGENTVYIFSDSDGTFKIRRHTKGYIFESSLLGAGNEVFIDKVRYHAYSPAVTEQL
jgi:hypothetical protein